MKTEFNWLYNHRGGGLMLIALVASQLQVDKKKDLFIYFNPEPRKKRAYKKGKSQ